MKKYHFALLLIFSISYSFSQNLPGVSPDDTYTTWMADNGNGTFNNPIFYEEFSDPDLIRVGDDYYLTGTTMHTMPGLPVLHSKDLVNWRLISYAVDRLDLGPELRLEGGGNFYGKGIWAPCLRYDGGTFYIFSNVNGYGTQLFSAVDPAGPWKHQKMKVSLHDLSVLFDDNGKKYAVWGYDQISIVELTDDLLDTIPGTTKVIVEAGSGAGEGCHFYKINGKYFITNTNYDPVCYQVCLRAQEAFGPYEIQVMSAEENFGEAQRLRIFNYQDGPPYQIIRYPENYVGCIPMHQGGIVQIQSGEWWGWSMLDYNSVGRVTALSPVTWEDGWPYFGLPGNLTRSPRTWTKPNTGFTSPPIAPFVRNDDFSGPQLNNVWQWNHVPDDSKWSLDEKNGFLRLHALPSPSFWQARNSLTQRGVGPESTATTKLEFSHLEEGDIAGLALLNLPYAWIGVKKNQNKFLIKFYNQQTSDTITKQLIGTSVWLQTFCNFDLDLATMSYSTDGINFHEISGEIILPYQLKTFQGVRHALFNFNTANQQGGYADFDYFTVSEPRHRGLTRPIPYEQIVCLESLADHSILVNWKNFLRPVDPGSPFAEGNSSYFKICDRGNGRVALQSMASGGFVTVKGKAGLAEVRIEGKDQGEASTFQWQDMLKGDIMLLSLSNHRYLFVDPNARSLCSANARGARPDRQGGACFNWKPVN